VTRPSSSAQRTHEHVPAENTIVASGKGSRKHAGEREHYVCATATCSWCGERIAQYRERNEIFHDPVTDLGAWRLAPRHSLDLAEPDPRVPLWRRLHGRREKRPVRIPTVNRAPDRAPGSHRTAD